MQPCGVFRQESKVWITGHGIIDDIDDIEGDSLASTPCSLEICSI